jgi:hypothetical protein
MNSPEHSSGRMMIKDFNPAGVECAIFTVDIFYQFQIINDEAGWAGTMI